MVKNCCRRVKSTRHGFKVRRLHNDFLARYWGHGKNRTRRGSTLSAASAFSSKHLMLVPFPPHNSSTLWTLYLKLVLSTQWNIRATSTSKKALRYHIFRQSNVLFWMVAHGQAFAILGFSCQYDFSPSFAPPLMISFPQPHDEWWPVPIRSSKQVESLFIRSRSRVLSPHEVQYISLCSFPSLICMIRDFYFSLDAVYNIHLVLLYLCISECRDPS